jgi:hypothetical protein
LATAVLNRNVTQEPVVKVDYVTVDNSTVDLELTLAEAETLLKVVRNVAGDEDTTRRAHTDRIMTALQDAGVWAAGHDFFRGNISFSREPDFDKPQGTPP